MAMPQPGLNAAQTQQWSNNFQSTLKKQGQNPAMFGFGGGGPAPTPRPPASGGFAAYGGGFGVQRPRVGSPAQAAAPQPAGGFQAYAPKTQQNFYNSPSGNLAYAPPGQRPPPFQQIVRDASGQQVDPAQMTNGRDAFIQAFNDWKAPHAQAFGMSGTPIPKTPVDQLWKQAGAMLKGGWTNPFAAQPTMPQDQGTPYGQSLLRPPTPQPGSSWTMMPVLRAHEDPMNPTGPNYQPQANLDPASFGLPRDPAAWDDPRFAAAKMRYESARRKMSQQATPPGNAQPSMPPSQGTPYHGKPPGGTGKKQGPLDNKAAQLQLQKQLMQSILDGKMPIDSGYTPGSREDKIWNLQAANAKKALGPLAEQLKTLQSQQAAFEYVADWEKKPKTANERKMAAHLAKRREEARWQWSQAMEQRKAPYLAKLRELEQQIADAEMADLEQDIFGGNSQPWGDVMPGAKPPPAPPGVYY